MMTGKKISLYILAAFIAGTLLLIYIQYNSAKNIDTLIKGNEKLLAEFRVSRELKELESDIFSVESKTRGAFITEDSSRLRELEVKIAEVRSDMDQLQKITDDGTTAKFIDELDKLVQQKLQFSLHLVSSFHRSGKNPPGNVITTQREKEITDSIMNYVQIIDSTRQKLFEKVTRSIDESGTKAQQLSNILIVLLLVSGAGLFWYIINIIRKQISLIQQLNVSEAKVKEAARLKENFMANMSHEIRTPMNAILGFTNLLQRKNLDEESKEYVQTLRKSGESLLTIINDILDLSKIEAGMVRIEAAPFSIRGLLHSIEVMLKPKAAEKQLQFSVNVDESIPDTLEGDATRLTQILVNLIGNALKFTDHGSVSINISNQGLSGDFINIHITVADTGIGVSKEQLQHIFERFQQAEDSVTRRYGGTGLGLSIVKDLVSLQHGTIDVESEPGKGTTFRLMIPYKISSDKISSNAVVTDGFSSQPDFEHVCVLVVEDNEINQNLIKHLFKRWQLNFDLATNGREAIDKLQLKKYEVILMDIQMPEMDGYTATQKIRNELKLDTPIIAMTAHAMAGEREKCLRYGMNEYISKPIREEQLHELIAQFTSLNSTDGNQNGTASGIFAGNYKYIDLKYMKEVSGGNIEYEKAVTEQFIEVIPVDLQLLEKAWQNNHINDLRHLAHNMKTTISVMGLNEVLQPHLDALEYEDLTEDGFRNKFSSTKLICESSVEEAKQFLKTI